MDDGLTPWLMSDVFGLEDTTPDVPLWFAEAACAGADTDRWFAGKGHTYTAALAVCGACDVRQECLSHALDVEGNAGPTHRFGMWGGMTPAERARVASSAA